MKRILSLLLAMCIASMAGAQLFNDSMEHWHTTFIANKALKGTDAVAPDGWHCHDSLLGVHLEYGHATLGSLLVQPDSDAHTGYIAAKLVSRNYLPYAYPAMLTNGKVQPDPQQTTNWVPGFKFTDGMAVSERIDSVKAWIKYAPVATDTAIFYAEALVRGIGINGSDSVVGGGIIRIDHPVNTYEEVGVKFLYRTKKIKPDLLRIVFASSPVNSSIAKRGSTLLVDDIRYIVDTTTDTTGDTTVYTHIEPVKGVKGVTCYPNPAAKKLQVEYGGNGSIYFYVYSIDGKLILGKSVSGKEDINVEHVAIGDYYWMAIDEKNNLLAKDKLVINR